MTNNLTEAKYLIIGISADGIGAVEAIIGILQTPINAGTEEMISYAH